MEKVYTEFGIVYMKNCNIGEYCDVTVVGNMPTIGYWQLEMLCEEDMKQVVKALDKDDRYDTSGFSNIDFESLEELRDAMVQQGIEISADDYAY